MNNKNDLKVNYYKDSKGILRRSIPKVCMNKKEHIQQRWEEKEEERLKSTGRGNLANDHQLVIDYLRSIHPEKARKMDIAKSTGLGQDRILIILNNLSGVCDDKKDEEEFVFQDFLVYEDEDEKETRYGIFRDKQLAVSMEGENE
jgi:hypothetical protein